MIHVHLTEAEARHFQELWNGAGQFRRNPNDGQKEQRERTIMALESVLWTENVRAAVGDDELLVKWGVRGKVGEPVAGSQRFERFGGAR